MDTYLARSCGHIPTFSHTEKTLLVSSYDQSNNTLCEKIDSANINLFLESWLRNPHVKVSRKIGLSASSMKTNDFLFFLQLILPICDTEESRVTNNERLPYYSKVEE